MALSTCHFLICVRLSFGVENVIILTGGQKSYELLGRGSPVGWEEARSLVVCVSVCQTPIGLSSNEVVYFSG